MDMTVKWYRKEWFLIIVAWVIIFASSPMYMYYAHSVGDFVFRWESVFCQWVYIAAYMVMFLIHHYLITPQFVNKRYDMYTACVFICIFLYILFLVYFAQEFCAPHGPHPGMERQHHPLLLLPPPDLGRLVGVLMMFLADIGIVSLISEHRLRQQYLLLEQQTLKHELMQLRYQINPHFFMNTLNNIHVLVDIDQERAKRAIVELSHMMRYSLYEGAESLTPLQHEVEFVQLYISLMKLRYPSKVEFICELPESTPSEVMIPPLLLATFIENAFKHGISYQKASFVYVSLKLENENNTIHFRCVNSRHTSAASTDDGHHGIGLTNVKKRLDLQYGDNYKLVIDDNNRDQYAVDLFLE